MCKNIPTVTDEIINNLLKESKIVASTRCNKVTVVTVELPNGFVLVESSGAVDARNYDKSLGKKICLGRIKDKLWELEGYKLACEVHEGISKTQDPNVSACPSEGHTLKKESSVSKLPNSHKSLHGTRTYRGKRH